MDFWAAQVLNQEVSRKNHANGIHGLCVDITDKVVQEVLIVTKGLDFGSRKIRALCKGFCVEGRNRGHACRKEKVIQVDERICTYLLVKTNNNRCREFGYVSKNSSQCFVNYSVLGLDGTVRIVTWLSSVTNDLDSLGRSWQ